jgi:hypothetical protein
MSSRSNGYNLTICKCKAVLGYWSKWDSEGGGGLEWSRPSTLAPVTLSSNHCKWIGRNEMKITTRRLGHVYLQNTFPSREPVTPSLPPPLPPPGTALSDSITDKKGKSIPRKSLESQTDSIATPHVSLELQKFPGYTKVMYLVT